MLLLMLLLTLIRLYLFFHIRQKCNATAVGKDPPYFYDQSLDQTMYGDSKHGVWVWVLGL